MLRSKMGYNDAFNGFLINHLFLISIAHRLCHTLGFIVARSRTNWVDMAPVQL